MSFGVWSGLGCLSEVMTFPYASSAVREAACYGRAWLAGSVWDEEQVVALHGAHNHGLCR